MGLVVGITGLTNICFKRDKKSRADAQAALTALGGGQCPFFLPNVWDEFAAGPEAAIDDALTAMGPLPAPAGTVANLQTAADDLAALIAARPSLRATDATNLISELGDESSIAAFRAAVGATTLGGGYGGDASNDAFSSLFAFLVANLP